MSEVRCKKERSMKKIMMWALMGMMALSVQAQRVIDKLDRGVVAVKTTGGVFVSWRIQSDEYYDVTYNLYRDGSMVAEGLKVSNYTDAAGTTASSYTVEAVKRGIRLSASAAVKPWTNSYLEIAPKHDASITSTLVPNDACCADVDGRERPRMADVQARARGVRELDQAVELGSRVAGDRRIGLADFPLVLPFLFNGGKIVSHSVCLLPFQIVSFVGMPQ